ncbi:MAG: hypothetical protein ACJA1E_000567 [Paracoccaceae bacterium]|jgi:hypothetical protein
MISRMAMLLERAERPIPDAAGSHAVVPMIRVEKVGELKATARKTPATMRSKRAKTAAPKKTQ